MIKPSMALPAMSYFTLKSLALQEGIDIIGVAAPKRLVEDEEHLKKWQEQGFAGDMKYMQRSAAMLSDPAVLMPELGSIIVCSIRYQSSHHPERPSGYGRVARYAWGKDYHKILPDKLKRFMLRVSENISSELSYRIFTDAVPLLERALAKSAGLGFVGRNSMLIRPGTGSLFFIAEVLTNLQIIDHQVTPVNSSCGTCNRCMPACPTNAIVSDFQIDARRCISYLTIEKKGSFSLWEREALSEWIFGCDICQDVCPFNHSAIKKDNPSNFVELEIRNGIGPLVSLMDLFKIKSNKEFNQIYRDTPLTRPGRAGLIRNGLCVAANTYAEELTEQLIGLFQSDQSPIVRQHALWAIFKIVHKCNNLKKERLSKFIMSASKDVDGLVRMEANQIGELGYV